MSKWLWREAVKTTDLLWQLAWSRNRPLEHLSVSACTCTWGGSTAEWERCVFFHPVGPGAGVGWGGASGGTAWGGLFQLNSVHCNRTRGGRSRSPAFLQSAVCLHDCRCAGGRWQLHITTPSDNTYCLYFCSLSTRETRILSSLFHILRTIQAFYLTP